MVMQNMKRKILFFSIRVANLRVNIYNIGEAS